MPLILSEAAVLTLALVALVPFVWISCQYRWHMRSCLTNVVERRQAQSSRSSNADDMVDIDLAADADQQAPLMTRGLNNPTYGPTRAATIESTSHVRYGTVTTASLP